VIVELANEDATDETPIDNPIVEWHEPVGNHGDSATDQNVEFDVVDIKRKGSQNVNVKITLQLKEFPNKFKLSPQLRNVLAIEEESKPGVVVAMWQYIKFHKLQDVDEKRLIKCDAALKELFNRDSFAFPQILELLGPHLTQRDPIVLDYTVRMDRENTIGEVAYDIEVEVDFDETRARLAKLLESWYSDRPKIAELDNQIALAVQALNISSLRRDFFKQISEDPVDFMKRWSDSQVRDLRTILADRGFDEEAVRRSSFYDDDLINQSVHLFLNTR
jgi:SWI/SNF-related matrix-associated actin-dependent regulator of chromatin subfamily D